MLTIYQLISLSAYQLMRLPLGSFEHVIAVLWKLFIRGVQPYACLCKQLYHA